MLQRAFRLFIGGQLFKHSARFSFEFTENKVQKLVSEEFLQLKKLTYDAVAFEAKLVKVF